MIVLAPRRTTRILAVVVLSLTAASLAGQFSKYFLGHSRLYGFVPLFDLKLENNVPTWYAASTFLFCSALLWVIASAKREQRDRYVFHWRVLSMIFLYLSADEAASLHERLGAAVERLLNPEGFLYYAWVIPYALFVIILAVMYRRFLADLPAETQRLFLIAGALYVGGAIGVESISGRHHQLYGSESFTYALLVTAEEFLEMMGVLVFVYALMSYMRRHIHTVQVLVAEDRRSPL